MLLTAWRCAGYVGGRDLDPITEQQAQQALQVEVQYQQSLYPPCCLIPSCGQHGTCTGQGNCTCDVGFSGRQCEVAGELSLVARQLQCCSR